MLKVRDLCRPGLSPVSFVLADGECVAVRGPSGSGKTLLLRAIADLDPCEGDVSLDGRDRRSMAGPAWRRLVRYVAAEPGWWAERVDEHFPDWPGALPLVRRLGLPETVGEAGVIRLSTGERQRLALVRALFPMPRVLLLDEPTGALDAAATAAVEEVVAGLCGEGCAVLWVTHDPAQARRIACRMLEVRAGSVREEAVA